MLSFVISSKLIATQASTVSACENVTLITWKWNHEKFIFYTSDELFSNANQMCLVPEWNQMIKITQIKKQIEILSGKIKLNKKWKQFSGVSKVND